MLVIRERSVVTNEGTVHRSAPEEARLSEWTRRLAVPRHRVLHRRENRWVGEELARAFEAAGFGVRFQGEYGNLVALPEGASGERLLSSRRTTTACPSAREPTTTRAGSL